MWGYNQSDCVWRHWANARLFFWKSYEDKKSIHNGQVVDLFEAMIEGKFAAFDMLEENKINFMGNIRGALIDTASKWQNQEEKETIS